MGYGGSNQLAEGCWHYVVKSSDSLQFVTSLHIMSSEMMSIGMGRVVFPAEEIADLSTWQRWVCGAHRRVRVIPGQCRPRPATLT